MPALTKTDWQAQIVWLGHVAAGDSIRSVSVSHLDLTFAGVTGGRHFGETRPSCVRVKDLYPRNTEIRNTRQLSVLSEEELSAIAGDIGWPDLSPEYLGASVVIRGVPDLTHLPPSSRLQAEDGTTLTVDMENLPCVLPGREIEADQPGHGSKFKQAAQGRRGVTAWVERPGRVRVGDSMTLFVPAQRNWQGG